MKLAIVFLVLAVVALALAGEAKQNQRKHGQRSLQNAGHKGAARKQNNHSASAKFLSRNRRANRNEEATANEAVHDIDREPENEGGAEPAEDHEDHEVVIDGDVEDHESGVDGYSTNNDYSTYNAESTNDAIEAAKKALNKAIALFKQARKALEPVGEETLSLGRAVLNHVSSGKSKRSTNNVTAHMNKLQKSVDNASKKLAPIAKEAVTEASKLFKSFSKFIPV